MRADDDSAVAAVGGLTAGGAVALPACWADTSEQPISKCAIAAAIGRNEFDKSESPASPVDRVRQSRLFYPDNSLGKNWIYDENCS
jgi:hypothetical protein